MLSEVLLRVWVSGSKIGTILVVDRLEATTVCLTDVEAAGAPCKPEVIGGGKFRLRNPCIR